MSNIVHLTSGAFPRVAQVPKPVLIDFWAPWCGPCRQQSPILDQVAETLGDAVLVAKVNVDEEGPLAAAFGVQSIPTLVVLKGGQIVKRLVGLQSRDALVAALRSA